MPSRRRPARGREPAFSPAGLCCSRRPRSRSLTAFPRSVLSCPVLFLEALEETSRTHCPPLRLSWRLTVYNAGELPSNMLKEQIPDTPILRALCTSRLLSELGTTFMSLSNAVKSWSVLRGLALTRWRPPEGLEEVATCTA